MVIEVPESIVETTAYEQGYNSSKTSQLLGMLACREQRALDSAQRVSCQLAKIGKVKKERKLRASVPDAFARVVPESHPFTCETVFASLLRGEFPLLYSLKGKHTAGEGAGTNQ